MERATTFLLVLLFSPECKVAFASALTKHYRDAVLFPETLPWPGVRRVRRYGGARAGTEAEEEEEGRAMGPSVRTALESRSERGSERSGHERTTPEHDSEFPSDAFETAPRRRATTTTEIRTDPTRASGTTPETSRVPV